MRGGGAEARSTSPYPNLSATQRAILEYIGDRPGSSIQDICDELELAYSTVQYNVEGMTKTDVVKTFRLGRKVRVFKPGTGHVARITMLLRNGGDRRILHYLAMAHVGNLSVNRIASDLDLTFGRVRRALGRFRRMGLIALDKVRGRFRIREKMDIGKLLKRVQEASAGDPGER